MYIPMFIIIWIGSKSHCYDTRFSNKNLRKCNSPSSIQFTRLYSATEEQESYLYFKR